MNLSEMIFWVLSAGAVASSVAMITSKRAVSSALLLVLTFCFLGGIYLTLNAQFMAVIQVAVYAGAIMVLVLFVIMLLNLKEQKTSFGGNWRTSVGLLAASGIAAQIIAVICANSERLPKGISDASVTNGTVEAVGMSLYQSYSFAFEMASIVLISAAIGAILLAKKRLV
jgi:NADH-quinone oxidoreductase subunit J